MTQHFGDRLAAAVAQRESQICLGLDPDPAKLWPGSWEQATHLDPRQQAADAVLAHCRAVIGAAGPACVAVKPQAACFERLGAPGWAALEQTIGLIKDAGLIALADVKRGDVPVTARAYAQMVVAGTPSPGGHLPGLGADAFTVNPVLGADALEPFVTAARAHGAAPIVLVRTSNPGAVDVFDLELKDGRPLWHAVAAIVDELGEAGESGIADVGAVLGATVPEHLAIARELMPHTPFLLPGVGAQGGGVEDLAPVFAAGKAGGLVSASRSIVNAYDSAGGDPAAAAQAEAERLRTAAWGLQ